MHNPYFDSKTVFLPNKEISIFISWSFCRTKRFWQPETLFFQLKSNSSLTAYRHRTMPTLNLNHPRNEGNWMRSLNMRRSCVFPLIVILPVKPMVNFNESPGNLMVHRPANCLNHILQTNPVNKYVYTLLQTTLL